MKNGTLQELSSLFFATRQIIRSQLPSGKADPNAWLRYETLRFIAESKGPTMHDVAAYLRITAPSATSFVKNLGAQGLIVRRGVLRDKRVTRIYLTRCGRSTLAAHSKRSVAALRRVFSKLNAAEIHELARVLRRLREVHSTKKHR